MGGKKSNHIKQFLARFKAVHTWQLFLILIPLLFLTATLLRFDHIKMTNLRAAVLQADTEGNDELIAERLNALQEFVFSHIVVNASETNGVTKVIFGTGPFYLEQQYLRAANAAIEAAESQITDDSNPHGNIYGAVGAICKPLAIANGWSWNSPGYLDCWTSELAKYPAGDELNTNLTANVPSTELYRYNYASPIWAPTFAGFAILACLILALIVIVRFVIWFSLRITLLFLKN